MHNLTTGKGKPGHPEGPKQQNHIAMNVKVISDPIAIVWQNEQKATVRMEITVTTKWDQL